METLRAAFFTVLSALVSVSTPAEPVAPELYSGLKWRLIGPFRGGRAVAVAGVPGDSGTFYFGAVNGGLWKTTDAGTVWSPIFDGEPVASIGALAIAPSDPKVIYVGTGESDIRSSLSFGSGVYKSVDAGRTWQHMGLEETRHISRVVVDPQNADVVYVGALGHVYGPNEQRGVYKSTDGGIHWERVLDQGPEIGVSDLAICASHPELLFATTWHPWRPPWSTYEPIDRKGGGLFRSRDGGKSWSRLSGNGLPEGDWGRVGVDVSPDGRRVYAVIPSRKAGLYRSDDGGDTWTLANEDPRLTSRAWYFGSITIDPINPDVLYVPNIALYRSEDGGKTISIVRGAPGGDDYHQIWIDPKNSSRMLLGTDQGATISIDRGESWTSWYNQPTAQLYHVTTDNQFPYVVYGTQQDSGSAAVPSRTDHYEITPRDWFPAGPSESGYMALDPTDANVIYLSSSYGGVGRFNRRTGLTQDVTPWPVPAFETPIEKRRHRAPWAPVLVFSPADPKVLLLGTQYVMKTVDGGLHWEKISADLTGANPSPENTGQDPPTLEAAKRRGFGVVSTIAPSPHNRDLLWAGSDTGLVNLTRDGGRTWTNVTPPGLSTWSKISLIEASHFDPAVAYVAVDRSRLDDQAPHLYRTRDYGVTWHPITDGISAPAFVRAIREDPENKQLLFAGTERGVYVSFDEGEHWQPLQLNLPVTSVRDLKIHGDDLVIATHGRSFWILDNITPLRQTSEASKANRAWLFHPATAVRVDNDEFVGTPLPPEEPVAKNPPDGAVIDYVLKSPAKDVTLEVYDGQTLVRKFSSKDPNAKPHEPLPIADRWLPKPEPVGTGMGMHRLVWDLSWGGPKLDAAFGRLSPPKVVPGTYELRLTVDGEVQAQSLRVAMDPRSPATPEVLSQQLQLGTQMFAEAAEAQRTLSELRSVEKQITDAQMKCARPSVKTPLTETNASVTRILANGDANGPPGLQEASRDLVSALQVVERGDRGAPSQAIAVYEESRQHVKTRLQEWATFKRTKLTLLNQRLHEEHCAPITTAGEGP